VFLDGEVLLPEHEKPKPLHSQSALLRQPYDRQAHPAVIAAEEVVVCAFRHDTLEKHSQVLENTWTRRRAFIGFGGRFPAMRTGSKKSHANPLPKRCNSTRPIGNRPQVGNPPHMKSAIFHGLSRVESAIETDHKRRWSVLQAQIQCEISSNARCRVRGPNAPIVTVITTMAAPMKSATAGAPSSRRKKPINKPAKAALTRLQL
jgi:hypothetical protein